MFNLHDFVLKGLTEAVGKMQDFQVILNASGWYDKGVLSEDDLADIYAKIEAKNTPAIPQSGAIVEVPMDEGVIIEDETLEADE